MITALAAISPNISHRHRPPQIAPMAAKKPNVASSAARKFPVISQLEIGPIETRAFHSVTLPALHTAEHDTATQNVAHNMPLIVNWNRDGFAAIEDGSG